MYDVFYSSGRALLSGGEKCYAFWIHNNASSSFSSSFSSSIMGRHMWDWYFFVMRMRISIFSIHKVWCCMMYSITCYILLDLLCWRMMKNVLIFHVIVIPHRHSSSSFSLYRVVRHMMRLVQFWCTIEIFCIFNTHQVWCILYFFIKRSSRCAILSDDEKCYAISIHHNHSSSTFSSSLVVRHIRLVLLL